MKLSVLCLLASPLLLAAALLPSAAPAPLDVFSIDPVHSSVLFKVRHLGVSNFYGMFKEIGGQISLDASDPAKSSVNFTIQAASVDSRNAKRDQHLSSPDFFSVKEFPTIEFKSASVKAAGKDEYEVAGKLTLHGVTKDLTLKVQQVGLVEGEKGKLAGFETRTTIKRSDYGMDYGLEQGSLGDDVEIIVSVEARVE
jgi:polyisoprenoid-binding protein YceI